MPILVHLEHCTQRITVPRIVKNPTGTPMPMAILSPVLSPLDCEPCVLPPAAGDGSVDVTWEPLEGEEEGSDGDEVVEVDRVVNVDVDEDVGGEVDDIFEVLLPASTNCCSVNPMGVPEDAQLYLMVL